MTDDSSLWRLLDRYLAGELAPAERERFERWVALSPERQAWVASLRKITRETSHMRPRSTATTDAAWLRVSRRLGLTGRTASGRGASWLRLDAAEAPIAPEVRAPRTAWTASYRHFRAQGRMVLAGMLAAGLVLVTGVTLIRELPGHVSPPRRFETRTGERETVTLSDGTQFTLAPASVVTVDAAYGESARSLTLDGEASFTVAHDARRPFTVRTPWVSVRDVGTRFVMRAYMADRRTQVAVREGAVALMVPGTAGPTATLRPGGAATVDGLEHVALRNVRDDDALFAWTEGQVVFRDTPLGDAARELGRTFDLQIQINDSSLARLPVTGTFSDRRVDVVLDDITAIVGARYQWSGRTVVIQRRARTGAAPRHRHP